MQKISVSIAGGAGYTAGELLRLLLRHPHARIADVLSTSQAGEPVADTHRDLLGETDMRFSAELHQAPDVMFLCLGHGLSREYLDGLNLPETTRVIDLGNDFRVESEHGTRRFVYGLSELFKDQIAAAHNIANPGCFATAILLGLVPLREKLPCEVHVHAVTGSTGAGRTPGETTHFSWRTDNFSVYKPFAHQHLGEIGKTLGESVKVRFVPMRGNFARGIFASTYFESALSATEAVALYEDFYRDSPFVHVSARPIALKEVVNTNKALVHIERHDGLLHVTAAIDNLLKGASGQAVQNMNLMFGLPVDAGLQLKPSAF